MSARKNIAIAAAAAVAVVGVGTTGAVAGQMVGSNMIKKEAVKSKHIADGTVKPKDLRPKVRKRINDATRMTQVDYASLAAPKAIENIGGSITERFTDLGTEVTLKKGTYLVSVDGSFINDSALPDTAEVFPQVSVWIDKNNDGKFDWNADPALSEGSISPNALMPTATGRHIQFSGSTVLELDKKTTVKIVGFGYDSAEENTGAGVVKVNEALLTASRIG